MSAAAPDLLQALLRDVSRSFYLTLRVLPGRVRRQIGLAYLLARASDTIADTDSLSKESRLALLEAMAARVDQRQSQPIAVAELARVQASPGERVLLERLEEAFTVLRQFEIADQERIQAVLSTIISGQSLDVQRFCGLSPGVTAALANDAQLDDYTYRVAGCVGEFWTKTCQAHLFPRHVLDARLLLSTAIRFGKGLQLVNILRDLPVDLRLGRCYIPEDRLRATGLLPADLLAPGRWPEFQPLYNSYLGLAEEHLRAGWHYTNLLPRGIPRVKLACAWPILIGVQTVGQLRSANVLDPSQRIKINRRAVRRIMLHSILSYPWPKRWQRLWDKFSQVPHRNTLPAEASLAT